MEQNSYGDIWNLKMLHSISSEYIDLVLYIDNKLEDQYNIYYTITEILGTMNSLDVLMGRNSMPP